MHPTQFDINEYIEGSAGQAERDAMQHHLRSCEECRGLLLGLQEIRRMATSLDPIEPPAQGWSRIDRAIRRDSRSWRAEEASAAAPAENGWSWSTALPAARGWVWRFSGVAAAVLAAALLVARMGYFGSPSEVAPGESTPTTRSIDAELDLASEHYQKAITGLEQIADAEKGTLDPTTAATLQKNLAVVDQAISESRAALRTEPDSEPAQQSLLESFKAKVTLLQDTVALINEMRKGNEAGAAEIVSEFKKGTS
jgi:hypothetical protein